MASGEDIGDEMTVSIMRRLAAASSDSSTARLCSSAPMALAGALLLGMIGLCVAMVFLAL